MRTFCHGVRLHDGERAVGTLGSIHRRSQALGAKEEARVGLDLVRGRCKAANCAHSSRVSKLQPRHPSNAIQRGRTRPRQLAPHFARVQPHQLKWYAATSRKVDAADGLRITLVKLHHAQLANLQPCVMHCCQDLQHTAPCETTPHR